MSHLTGNVPFWGCKHVLSILLVVVWMKKICVFDEVFYPFCNCWCDNWRSVVFPFLYQLLLRRQISSTHYQYHSFYEYQTCELNFHYNHRWSFLLSQNVDAILTYAKNEGNRFEVVH